MLEEVDACLRQRREGGFVDERGNESRRARMRLHDVAEASRHDVPAARQRARNLVTVRGWRHRIEAARQQQHGDIARDGLVTRRFRARCQRVS